MAGEWGGKYALPFDAYHATPPEWQAPSLVRAHEALGGTYPLRGTVPRVVWYELADGIRAGDAACVELAIRFIQAHLIVSYAGFARQRLARALRHAQMTGSQRRALSMHFLKLVERQERCHEFREYLDLWSDIADDEVRGRAIAIAAAHRDDSFAAVIIRRMSHAVMPARPQRAKAPRWFYPRRRSPVLGLRHAGRERWVAPHRLALKRSADEAGKRFAAAMRAWHAAEFEFRVDAARHGGKPWDASRALAAQRQDARDELERTRRVLGEASGAFRSARAGNASSNTSG